MAETPPVGTGHLTQRWVQCSAHLNQVGARETDMKRLITLMVLMSIGGLIGCNTMEGAGKDIERTGEVVSETAQDVKRDM
jgi:entericidin B